MMRSKMQLTAAAGDSSEVPGRVDLCFCQGFESTASDSYEQLHKL